MCVVCVVFFYSVKTLAQLETLSLYARYGCIGDLFSICFSFILQWLFRFVTAATVLHAVSTNGMGGFFSLFVYLTVF